MTRYAAAYLRRSQVTIDNPGNASREAQTSAVQKLCGASVTIYSDWGVSGTKADRPEYVRLKADIAAGKVESVCAYSLSRLGRSMTELLSFVDLCRLHNVTLRTAVENIDTSTAMGTLVFNIMASIAAFEADAARERTVAGITAQKAKGHDLRRPGVGFKADVDANGLRILVPNGEANAVIAAYKEAKTFEGAARILTEKKVITQYEQRKVAQAAERGEVYVGVPKVWSTSVVVRTLRVHAPELLPPQRPGATKLRHGKGLFARLVRCPDCQTLLTAREAKASLYCSKARKLPHTKTTIPYSKLRSFAEAESAKYQPQGIVLRGGGNDAARRELTEAKERISEVRMAGGIDAATYQSRLAVIDSKLAVLASSDQAIAAIIPNPVGVDWTKPDAEVGDELRNIWASIELNPDWTPKAVVWRVPSYLFDPVERAKRIAELDAETDAAQKAGA